MKTPWTFFFSSSLSRWLRLPITLIAVFFAEASACGTVVTVESFYEVSDADDTPSFVRAIAQVRSDGGGVIQLEPHKTYHVTGPIDLVGQGIIIRGQGIGTAIRNNSASGATFRLGIDHGDQAAYCEISNLRFEPGVTRDSGTYEVDAQNGTGLTFHKVYFFHIWGCIRLGTPSAIRAIASITDVRAVDFHQFLYAVRFIDARVSRVSSDPMQADAVGIILDGGVESCEFSQNDLTGGGTTGLWLRKTDYTGSPPRFNNFIGGYFDGCVNGFIGDAGDENEFDGVWFNTAPGALGGLSGVRLNAGMNGTVLRGGRSFEPGVHGLFINGATNTVASDFIVRSAGNMAFYIDGGGNTVLNNPRAYESGNNGIGIAANNTGGVTINGGVSAGSTNSDLFVDTGVQDLRVNALAYHTINNASPATTNITRNENGVFSATGAISAANGYIVPTSRGAAVFAADSTASGFTTLANNGTLTPFGVANNFSGLILVNTDYDGNCAAFLTGGNQMVKVSSSTASMTTSANNAGTINVYLSGSVVTVQNKTGGSIGVNVTAFRTRNGQ